MGSVMGHATNAVAQPVRYSGGSDGGFDQEPTPGFWVADGEPVDVIKLPLGREERNRAGIDVDPEAHELYFNLLPDAPSPIPIGTRSTVRIDDGRYNVVAVEPYEVPGFNVGIAQIVRL